MTTVLITGTSSGIGMSTALELARKGHSVIATMRNPGASPDLAQTAAREGLPMKVLTLDVNSDESVRSCFAAVTEPIDVLVNNAGIECHGSVEELSMEDIIGTMNTNYFGIIRCIKAVLPRMREARSGCIINISSIAGRIAGSPLGAYAASKFALEAISEAVAGEVKPFNIRVVLVQPGIQDTKMARSILEKGALSLYPQVARFSGLFRAALDNPVLPAVTAQVVCDIIDSGSWQFRQPSGPDAAPFLAWRAGLSDEQWIQWNAQEDEDWYQQVEREFGMNARPQLHAVAEAAVAGAQL
jgi:NAD(P)-dependent dehydrogenase (short-subunit alcohol dehydrogenase family)